MDPGEVRQLVLETQRNPNKILIVDARSDQEYSAGHIPGAMNVPLMALPIKEGRVEPYASYDYIVVYGTTPDSVPARGVAKRFMSNKYRDVYVLKGGLKEWAIQGGEIVKGEK